MNLQGFVWRLWWCMGLSVAAYAQAAEAGFTWYGLTEASALAQARAGDIPLRIATRDGVGLPLTEDYVPGRVTIDLGARRVVFARVEGKSAATEGTLQADLEPYIGITEDAARQLAASSKRPLRVIARDGEEFLRTMDFNPRRINVRIHQGIVRSASSG